MKDTAMADSSEILHKLETIEKELTSIKLFLLKKQPPSGEKVISLKGIIKGVDVDEDDIELVKHSLYSKPIALT